MKNCSSELAMILFKDPMIPESKPTAGDLFSSTLMHMMTEVSANRRQPKYKEMLKKWSTWSAVLDRSLAGMISLMHFFD